VPPVGNLAGKRNIKPSGGTVLFNQAPVTLDHLHFYLKENNIQVFTQKKRGGKSSRDINNRSKKLYSENSRTAPKNRITKPATRQQLQR